MPELVTAPAVVNKAKPAAEPSVGACAKNKEGMASKAIANNVCSEVLIKIKYVCNRPHSVKHARISKRDSDSCKGASAGFLKPYTRLSNCCINDRCGFGCEF